MEENNERFEESGYDSLVEKIKNILQYVELKRLDDTVSWKYFEACKSISKLITEEETIVEDITEEMISKYFRIKYRGAFFIAMQVHATEMLYFKYKNKSHVAHIMGCNHATIIHRLSHYKKPYWYKDFVTANFNKLIATNRYPKSFATTTSLAPGGDRVGITKFKEI